MLYIWRFLPFKALVARTEKHWETAPWAQAVGPTLCYSQLPEGSFLPEGLTSPLGHHDSGSQSRCASLGKVTAVNSSSQKMWEPSGVRFTQALDQVLTLPGTQRASVALQCLDSCMLFLWIFITVLQCSRPSFLIMTPIQLVNTNQIIKTFQKFDQLFP